jgi:tRNA1Val (adenine37-N6)-methyltransferase
MSFLFKQFSVEDDKSSMRIGTDAVILGAWVNVTAEKNILEIGTGCGVVSLMLAQRSNAGITAIDIHSDSVEQALGNFRDSSWSDRLSALHISFQEFSNSSDVAFDLIVANPPFFKNSLKSPASLRNISRHDDQLTITDLFQGVSKISHANGLNKTRFCIIIPFLHCEDSTSKAKEYGFYLERELIVYPKQGKPPHRVVLEFCNGIPAKVEQMELMIRQEDGSYSERYRELTKEFYIGLAIG